ncbi:MAG: YraN family protein [Firmicutes bacterium]|nr:YraN family protein [Bacillota bacterium]
MKTNHETNRENSVSCQTLGTLGENLAAGLLTEEGYEILMRNYRCRYGEIDLIACRDGILTFVEVKTRQNSRFGEPAEAVTTEKQRKIRRTAVCYLSETGRSCRGMEFQVVEISVRHLTGLTFQEVGTC